MQKTIYRIYYLRKLYQFMKKKLYVGLFKVREGHETFVFKNVYVNLTGMQYYTIALLTDDNNNNTHVLILQTVK